MAKPFTILEQDHCDQSDHADWYSLWIACPCGSRFQAMVEVYSLRRGPVDCSVEETWPCPGCGVKFDGADLTESVLRHFVNEHRVGVEDQELRSV